MKINIILEDNPDKVCLILHKMDALIQHPIFIFSREHEALSAIASLVLNHNPLKLTLFIDGEILSGSGVSFLNRVVDDWPAFIEKVVPTSYSDTSRKEMYQICWENLIKVEEFQ